MVTVVTMRGINSFGAFSKSRDQLAICIIVYGLGIPYHAKAGVFFPVHRHVTSTVHDAADCWNLSQSLRLLKLLNI